MLWSKSGERLFVFMAQFSFSSQGRERGEPSWLSCQFLTTALSIDLSFNSNTRVVPPRNSQRLPLTHKEIGAAASSCPWTVSESRVSRRSSEWPRYRIHM